MTIDWANIFKSLEAGDIAAPLALLAARERDMPAHEDTIRLGFAIHSHQRDFVAADTYLKKLEVLHPTASDIALHRLHLSAWLSDWDAFTATLARAPGTTPPDAKLLQRALCARLVREGLFDGWQNALNAIIGLPGYEALHFTHGLHQLAITLLAIGQPAAATTLLHKLHSIAPVPHIQLAVLRDLQHIAAMQGDAKTAATYANATAETRRTQPALAQALDQVSTWAKPCPAPTPIGADAAATVIVPTSISRKIFKNTHIAPPYIDMLAETLSSFYKHAKAPTAWPVVICFDQPTAPDLQDAAARYRTALEDYVQKNPHCTLRVYTGNGLRRTFVEQSLAARTPYVCLLEHDWVFNSAAMPITDIFAAMQANPAIHHCRYNVNPVLPDGYDSMLLPAAHGLTSTSGFGNQPGLIRTHKLQRDWLPLLAFDDTLDALNHGAAGVEETLQTAAATIYNWLGFIEGHASTGTYFAGALGSKPPMTHTGI